MIINIAIFCLGVYVGQEYPQVPSIKNTIGEIMSTNEKNDPVIEVKENPEHWLINLLKPKK